MYTPQEAGNEDVIIAVASQFKQLQNYPNKKVSGLQNKNIHILDMPIAVS